MALRVRLYFSRSAYQSSFFSKCFVKMFQGVQLCNSTDTAASWENSCFILTGRSNLHMVDHQSIAVHALRMRILTLLSADKISLRIYELTLPNESLGYDTKESDGEASLMLELWGMRSTPSLPSLLGPLWHGVVAPDRVLYMSKIKLFEI